MKLKFYLTVNSRGSVKTTKTKPALDWDEIAINCNLELPDALFKKPSMEATIIIPDEAALPQIITAETANNIKEAIEQAAGINVRISFPEIDK